MVREQRRRQLGIPRDTAEYRFWRRNNRISWNGVETKRKEHPPLVKKTSRRGETHYVELW